MSASPLPFHNCQENVRDSQEAALAGNLYVSTMLKILYLQIANCALFSLSLYSTLTLYDGDIGSSPSLELTTSDSSLADNGWNNRASSAVVSGGCQWVLYDLAAGFSSSTSVIGPGSYPEFSTSTFGIPENSLSAVRCLPVEGTQALVLFEDGHYVGQMQVIYSSRPDLALTNFDNIVSSFIITGGAWELYSGANYTGSNITLGQGRYPTPFFLRPIANDDLTSMRLIIFGRKTNLDLFDAVLTYCNITILSVGTCAVDML